MISFVYLITVYGLKVCQYPIKLLISGVNVFYREAGIRNRKNPLFYYFIEVYLEDSIIVGYGRYRKSARCDI